MTLMNLITTLSQMLVSFVPSASLYDLLGRHSSHMSNHIFDDYKKNAAVVV